MTKKKKIIISAISAGLAVIIALSVALTVILINKNKIDFGPEAVPMLPERVAETNVKVVENGKTDYKIVIPAECDDNIAIASSELQTFMAYSTGVTLPIIKDTDVDFNQDEKYISLGYTTIFNQSGLEITEDMRLTGYLLKRFGNTLICNAKNSNGVLSAVYDMLSYMIGFEAYASDEIYYEKKESVALLDFNVKFIPTVDIREIRYRSLSADAVYNRRMKLFNWFGLGLWISFGHTVIGRYITVEEFGESHPEYFNASQSQVCYSNDEMRDVMAEKIKYDIAANPYGMYVMIGHEDNGDMCECADCVKERKEMGGYGGQELNFANEIASIVDPWVKENYPDREITYLFFAYQTSSEPPCEWSESEQKYLPVNEKFDVHERVGVLFCPIEANFAKPFNSKENQPYYNKLKGWYDLFETKGAEDNIVIWTYSLPVLGYFAPQNNFGMYFEHYKTMSDMGVNFIFDQAVYDSGIPCFEQLKIYTQAKAMYRSDLSYNDLAYDFIEHYYGEASEGIKEYYNFIRSYYKYLEETQSFMGGIWTDTTLENLWTMEVLNEMMAIFEKCFAQIEGLKTTDPDRYEVLNSRIKREQLTPQYLLFSYYLDVLPQDKKEAYWYDLNTYTKKFEIVSTRESGNDVEKLISDWKEQIFG